MQENEIVNLDFKAISPIVILVNAMLLICIGILLMSKGIIMYELLMMVILGFVIFSGAKELISGLSKNQPMRGAIIFFAYMFFSIFLVRQKIILGASIPFLFGLWFIVNAALRLILAIQCIAMKLVGEARHIIAFLVSLGFGLSLIFKPLKQIDDLTFVIGLYMILYGIFTLSDFFEELMSWDKVATKIRRRARIPVPLFVAAFIPKRALSSINRYFESTDAEKNRVYMRSKALVNINEVDLEIFIHLKEEGFESFGHVDICYEGKVYSYGCYDHHSNLLGGFISDGTIAISEREKYIHHCLNFEHKVLVGYGILLSQNQRAQVEKSIENLKALFIPWKSDFQKIEDGEMEYRECKDPASELYKATGASIYKLSSGPFKKYFALSTNCVQLADTITGSAGLDALSVKGVITPGNYYSLLNNMFERKNTIVVSKNVYK